MQDINKEEEEELECMIIVRSRLARSTWEKFCMAVVGNPVHMDVVLAEPHSSSARFCFSAYVNQEFEMCLMEASQVMDSAFINQCIRVTKKEYDSCMKFMMDLVESRTKYDYMDALLLMPMAPKGMRSAARFASVFKDILQDVEVNAEKKTLEGSKKKVFCSQSVALMLRECLNREGIHGLLVEKLALLNSRLVSPKMVFECIQAHPFTEAMSNKELQMLGIAHKK